LAFLLWESQATNYVDQPHSPEEQQVDVKAATEGEGATRRAIQKLETPGDNTR